MKKNNYFISDVLYYIILCIHVIILMCSFLYFFQIDVCFHSTTVNYYLLVIVGLFI